MIQRATGPQCLGARASALADGSLPDDVRDRALAHVTSCPDCRADLEAERLLLARLQALPTPRPSESLVAALLAMGEPGGPVPPRPGHVPGTPRPRPATIRREPVDAPWESVGVPALPWHRVSPGRRATSRSPELPARPGPTSRPGGRMTPRRRTVVGATAGAVGAGVIAAALAGGLPVSQPVTPVDHLQAAPRVADLGPAREAQMVGDQVLADVGTGQASSVQDIGLLLAGSSPTGLSLAAPRPQRSAASAVPGVTTTVLRHLLATPVLVGQTPPSGVHLGSTGYLSGGGYLWSSAR
ncbi:MAG TPA: zf-HC2 domain-containing protein [Actinomycetales bacterium]|nr:zf-HC2 domain-containing protein [Actinomycetales bacterium]